MRQICLDTETTGLNADKDDRIVEIVTRVREETTCDVD